jgi:hypothetical protein
LGEILSNLPVPRRGAIALAAALVFGMASPALAEVTSDQYRGCDGYGAASREGDGMTSYATVLFIFSPPNWGNTAQSAAELGTQGIGDCDAALSELSEHHWMRKVSLLRARAMHRLETGDATGALADLDLATAAAATHDDPLYARSLGLGVKLTRAYALRLKGDQAGADALAAEALQARPYSRQVSVDVLLAVGLAGNTDVRRTALHSLVRLAPGTAELVFEQSFDAMMFDDAVALYPAMLAAPSQHGAQEGRSAVARRAGMYAYALAALGRNDEARAALAAARQTSTMPSMTAAPNAPDGADTAQGLKAPSQGTEAEDPALKAWRMAVEWRIQVSQGHTAEVLNVLHTMHLPRSAMSVDLVTALAAVVPPKVKATLPALDSLRPDTDAQPDVAARMLTTFFKTLPGPETSHNLPSLSEKGFLDTNGASVTQAGAVTTITFRAGGGTLSAIEEMALLKAAELARDAGKKGIVVMNRDDTRYTLTTTYYGTPLRTDPNGFSSVLNVEFVDPAAPSDADKAMPWRVIDADDVYTQLEPIYRPGRKSH